MHVVFVRVDKLSLLSFKHIAYFLLQMISKEIQLFY